MPDEPYRGAEAYWGGRYRSGGNSGAGSYGRLAAFKAEVLNDFVARQGIGSVIEFGCGDGNQLSLAAYPSYIGLDIAPQAIALCKDRFRGDASKSFFLYNPDAFVDNHRLFLSDQALSLDVIFHLTEDHVFETYMSQLFQEARRSVVIYSSDKDEPGDAPHVRHRRFTDWVRANRPDWKPAGRVKNRFPFGEAPGETSFSDFHFFEKS